MRRSVLNSRFLQSSAIVAAVASAAVAGPASAQNLTVANVNVLNLLSPFLTLDSTPIGQQTLYDNLPQAIAINQNAASAATLNGNLSTSALAALAISDENLLGSASNTVYEIATTTTFGPAANLAGGLPPEDTTSYGTTVKGSQTTGGFGSILGAAYVNDVSPSSVTLPNTVALLTTAFGFTGNTLSTGNSQVAKFYFANGTWNGTTTAVGAGRLHAAELRRSAQQDRQRLQFRLQCHEHAIRPERLWRFAPLPDPFVYRRSDLQAVVEIRPSRAATWPMR